MDHLVILNGCGVGSSGCLGTRIACRAVQAPLLVTVLSWRGAVGLVPFTLLGAAEGVHPPGSSLEAVPWSHGEPAQPDALAGSCFSRRGTKDPLCAHIPALISVCVIAPGRSLESGRNSLLKTCISAASSLT